MRAALTRRAHSRYEALAREAPRWRERQATVMVLRRVSRSVMLVMALASVGACRSKATREWRPEDHDPGGAPPTTATTAAGEGDPLAAARALFAAQCASCHGPEGHGDGPMAAMFRPADLGDPALQGARSDEELANSILRGRGRMPGFAAQLRPEAAPMLVRLIRSWRRR